MYWLFIRSWKLNICAFRGVLFMTAIHMKLKCRHNHKPSGRVFLVSTRDSINDFMTWGKYCYIPFIVLANSLFIWGPTIEFSLMRLILPSLFLSNGFYPSMAFAQEGPFFLAPTESRILSQLQRGVTIDQIIKS